MPFKSTKTFGHELGLSACFRQWRAESHCKLLHGYALAIRIEFEASELDSNNWVVDFGSMKVLKQRIVDTFDHKLLVAQDDPASVAFSALRKLGLADVVVVDATGCEAFAKLVYDFAVQWLRSTAYWGRVAVKSVEVREHGANSAIYLAE